MSPKRKYLNNASLPRFAPIWSSFTAVITHRLYAVQGCETSVRGNIVQRMHRPRDTSSKNFRSGTHRLGTHYHGIWKVETFLPGCLSILLLISLPPLNTIAWWLIKTFPLQTLVETHISILLWGGFCLPKIINLPPLCARLASHAAQQINFSIHRRNEYKLAEVKKFIL